MGICEQIMLVPFDSALLGTYAGDTHVHIECSMRKVIHCGSLNFKTLGTTKLSTRVCCLAEKMYENTT